MDDENPLERSFESRNLVELSGNNISLLIIAKTKMNRGHCYLGLSLEDKIIYRPIYREAPGKQRTRQKHFGPRQRAKYLRMAKIPSKSGDLPFLM